MNNSISLAFANLLLGALHSFLLKKQQQQKQKHYKKQTDPGTVGPTVISALKILNKETWISPCTTNLEFDLNDNFWKNNKEKKTRQKCFYNHNCKSW